MKTDQTKPGNVEEYIATFPPDVQTILKKVRATIRQAVPDARETISYQIPAFRLNGSDVIYFAGYKKHFSLYPAPIGKPEFAEALSAYRSGKATAKFPLDKPIPLSLIAKLAAFMAAENGSKRAASTKKRATP